MVNAVCKPLFFFALLLGANAPAFSQVRLTDGDTLSVDGATYRLNGIDAPEYAQVCESSEGTWKCGEEALGYLAELVAGKKVNCAPISEDGFGRIIATCFVDGEDLGASMVSSGRAWAFVKFSDEYVEEEANARKARLGIWSGINQPAWEFRAEKWRVAEQKAPEGCPIKGNISSNGKIYHPPWSPWYSRTKISVEKGERWFCDEAEALAAGWRAPRWR